MVESYSKSILFGDRCCSKHFSNTALALLAPLTALWGRNSSVAVSILSLQLQGQSPGHKGHMGMGRRHSGQGSAATPPLGCLSHLQFLTVLTG